MSEKAAQDTRSGQGHQRRHQREENGASLAIVEDCLARLRVVLIHTTHPGNIGATARAMKVMGLRQLHLVAPKIYPSADATARASGADDILEHAVVHESLEPALEGCGLVLGTSARLRSLPMPLLDARAAAGQAVVESEKHEVAVLFGRERHGLTNEEMQRCHFLVNIPTNPKYGSLNIAQAVQIMAYEFRLAAMAASGGEIGIVVPPSDWEPVDGRQMEMLFEHLEQTLLDLEFLNPDQPKKLMMRLRRLFNRARPDQNEMNILRGILRAAQEAARKL
jgi:TrmH family RNA methyltransferase